MALKDDKKKAAISPPDTYYQQVRSSPGMRLLRGEMDWQKRRDAAYANINAAMTKQQQLSAPKPAPTPPAVAAPKVAFAGIDAEPTGMFKTPAPQNRVRTPAELAQASQAEGNAQTASRPGTPQGAGAPSAAGAGSASYYIGGDGKRRTINPDGTIAGTSANAMSVNKQSFGTSAVPQAQASIASPRVASTFGLGVNDPRLNDQTPAIASPNAAARGFGLASADGTSRYYANKEDREAAKKLYDSMDTEAFRLSMAANNPGRRGRQAMETLSALRGQQAKLIGDQANNTAAQISDNTRGQFTLANTGMEQAGQTQRQRMAGDVASQGQFLEYDAKNRATDASLIEKPQYVTDRAGNLVQVTGGKATGVTGSDGAVIQMPPPAQAQQRDYQAEAFNSLVADLMEGQRDATGALPPNAVESAIAQAQKVQAARQPQAQATQVTSKAQLDALPKGARYIAPDGKTYTKN